MWWLLQNYIDHIKDVKQYVCNFTLFSLFINELAFEILNRKHGAMFSYDFMKIFILLSADDNVLMSQTVMNFRIYCIYIYCIKHQ